jgi:ATP-dependent Lhr-like helicase
MGALDRFSPRTREWFDATFDAPTPAQEQGWDAISKGEHTLILAPTGSGKTLAAFLWAIDRLLTEAPPEDEKKRCRVLYVSPLKALTYDVERNLRAPLTGIELAADRAGERVNAIRVATRTGAENCERGTRQPYPPPVTTKRPRCRDAQ